MIIDAIPFSADSEGNAGDLKSRALGSVVKLIEQKLGVFVGYDARNSRFERPDLADAFRLAALLEQKGVLRTLSRETLLPDEPRMYLWRAICNESSAHAAGGASLRNDRDSLYAALSECLERYIWFSQTDYFKAPTWATTAQMRERGNAILPERFSGFTDTQRTSAGSQSLDENSEFLWVQGTSLITHTSIYLPAQTISGAWGSYHPEGKKEPSIRRANTIGLATWPTLAGARLAGALETIERDAYMVMWLNQLTLPRIALAPIAEQHSALANLVRACERYQLRIHVIKMPTDAPTHAVCVVMEDLTGTVPRFSFGLKAHRSLPLAIEKAATEALRARTGQRRYTAAGNIWDPNTPMKDIGHRERMYYWGIPKNAERLEFVVSGKEEVAQAAEWEKDTEDEHLARVVSWCKTSGFECISVPLTSSKSNPTSLSVEMIAIPELQCTYLAERLQAFGGSRWKDVPEKLGYKARKEPFADAPHPFS